MKRKNLSIITSVFCSLFLVVTPLGAWADDAPPPEPTVLPPIIITEVQTGAAMAGDEFIELFNASDQAVDISGWQLRTATVVTPEATFTGASTKFVTIELPGGGPILVAPGASYVLKLSAADAGIPADLTYATGLTKTEKALALFAPNSGTCKLEVQDAVAWVAANAIAGGEGRPLVAASNKDILLVRYLDGLGKYVDTNDNLHDFFINPAVASGSTQPRIAAGATPQQKNTMVLPADSVTAAGSQSQLSGVDITDCVVPAPPEEEPPDDTPEGEPESPPAVIETPEAEPETDGEPQPSIPVGNTGLKTPMLSELLPNPASPQTDKEDEFIELYNPNGAYFDLSGYVLEVGLTTKRRYTIPAGTKIPPQTFLALFSAQTNLALSNSGGQVALFDPLGRTLAMSEPYGTAKDGQAWVLANGIWQWTTKPTPNAVNIVSAPAVKSKSTTKKGTVISTASTKNKTGASGQSAGTNSTVDVEQAAAVATSTGTPLHPGVLALIAGSAVLYGAYEYRRDVANRFYQFRTNRAARRALRQGTEGR